MADASNTNTLIDQIMHRLREKPEFRGQLLELLEEEFSQVEPSDIHATSKPNMEFRIDDDHVDKLINELNNPDKELVKIRQKTMEEARKIFNKHRKNKF